MGLTSGEKRLVSFFILQSKEQQKFLLHHAELNPQTSGPLIIVYRWLLENT